MKRTAETTTTTAEKKKKTVLRICRRDFVAERLPAELREAVYGWVLEDHCIETVSAETYRTVRTLLLTERASHRVLYYQFLLPLMQYAYASKMVLGTLSIRQSASLIDLLPQFMHSFTACCTVFSLMSYYNTARSYPLLRHTGEPVPLIPDDAQVGRYFIAEGDTVRPLYSHPSLAVISSVPSKKSKFDRTVARFIASHTDEDDRQRLQHLLLKTHGTQRRSFFLRELCQLHHGVVDAERTQRRLDFPLTLTPLTEMPPAIAAQVKLADLAYRLPSGEQRHFLASKHAEVIDCKRSLFRIFTSVDVAATSECLAIAVKSHRLQSRGDEMRRRMQLLIRSEPVVIDLL